MDAKIKRQTAQPSSSPTQKKTGHDIDLDLSRHCIETACRRQYNRSISLYFKNPPDPRRLEREIDLLRRALETLDFGRLRREYAELAGGYAEPVVMGMDENDRIIARVHDRILPLSR